MGYGGESGLRTVFPTASAPSRAKSAGGGSKRPCKYGPRDADGFCPKAPRRSSGRSGASKRPCKYGPRDADGYCPKKPASERQILETAPPKEPRAPTRRPTRAERQLERNVDRIVQRGARDVARRGAESRPAQLAAATGAAAWRKLQTPVKTLAAGGAASASATLGLVIAAGVGSFLATSKILKSIAARKERRQAAAFEAAQAMRRARLDAEEKLGRKLTLVELRRIAREFDLNTLMRKAGL